MKRMIQSLIVVAVGVMIAVPTVFAEPSGKMDKGTISSRKQIAKDIFKELDLTVEQKDRLSQNRVAQQKKMKELQTQIKEKQAELTNKLSDPDVSRASVEPIATDIKSLQAKLIDYRIDEVFAMKEILTPEQYAKFQKKMKEQQEKVKERAKDLKEQQRGQRGQRGQ